MLDNMFNYIAMRTERHAEQVCELEAQITNLKRQSTQDEYKIKEYVKSFIYMNNLLCDEVERKTHIHMELNTVKDVLVEKDAELAAKDAELAAKDAELAAKDAELAAKDAQLAAKTPSWLAFMQSWLSLPTW
jgi:hypothetical protein